MISRANNKAFVQTHVWIWWILQPVKIISLILSEVNHTMGWKGEFLPDKTPDHPQTELGLPHVWPEPGSNSQRWDDKCFKALKISLLNHWVSHAWNKRKLQWKSKNLWTYWIEGSLTIQWSCDMTQTETYYLQLPPLVSVMLLLTLAPLQRAGTAQTPCPWSYTSSSMLLSCTRSEINGVLTIYDCDLRFQWSSFYHWPHYKGQVLLKLLAHDLTHPCPRCYHVRDLK